MTLEIVRSLPGIAEALMMTMSPLPMTSLWEEEAMRARPLMGSPWLPVVMTQIWLSLYLRSFSTSIISSSRTLR